MLNWFFYNVLYIYIYILYILILTPDIMSIDLRPIQLQSNHMAASQSGGNDKITK